jgi:hypothetical protein
MEKFHHNWDDIWNKKQIMKIESTFIYAIWHNVIAINEWKVRFN